MKDYLKSYEGLIMLLLGSDAVIIISAINTFIGLVGIHRYHELMVNFQKYLSAKTF